MDVTIITAPFNKTLFGFSGTAINKDYAATGIKLMDKMWQTIRSNNLKHKGINIWVYEQNEKVFAGVELETNTPDNTGMEFKSVTLTKYGYYKHIGPYSQLKHVGQALADELKNRGYEVTLPYIEIYGHWTEDETKLETELLMSLK